MRIQCTGKIKVDGDCVNIVSHSDMRVEGDLTICLADDVTKVEEIEIPSWVDDLEDELDGLVDDMMSHDISALNNCGPREQYEYLIHNNMTPEAIAGAIGRDDD